jgi:hypothetical protein
MGFLSDTDREALAPAERAAGRTPIPTQMVSSDETSTPTSARCSRRR